MLEACSNAQCFSEVLHDQCVLNAENYITPYRVNVEGPIVYSSSSPSFSAMLKYLSSYTLRSLLEAITRSQSLTLCFLRYFFVRYFRYLLDIGISDVTTILNFSLDTFTESPSTPMQTKGQVLRQSNSKQTDVRKSSRVHGSPSHRCTLSVEAEYTPRPFFSLTLARCARCVHLRSKPWCRFRHGRGSIGRAVHPRFLFFPSSRSSASFILLSHRSILSCLAPRFLPLDACSGRVSRRRGRTCFASHFDPFGEESFEGGDVHDLILRWLGTVDHELVLWAFATCSWSDHRGWMQHEGVSDWYRGTSAEGGGPHPHRSNTPIEVPENTPSSIQIVGVGRTNSEGKTGGRGQT